MTCQTEHFFVGFEYPQKSSKMATIYLNGVAFGATWHILDPDLIGYPYYDTWALNRWGLAIEMGLPAQTPFFHKLEELLEYLEKWYSVTVELKQSQEAAEEHKKANLKWLANLENA